MCLRTGEARARRRMLVAACTAVLLSLTVACSGTAGTPRAAGRVAGLPITNFDSGLRDDAPRPDVEVRNATDSVIDRIARAAVADIVDYWSETMPEHFGQEFDPVDGYLSYDPNGKSFEVCGTTTSEIGPNAFYCPPADIIAWDRAQLLPRLYEHFGPMAIVTVLAHEYGHAIQTRLGARAGIDVDTKTIVREQQADCFTGSYMRWVAEGHSEYFKLSTSKGLNQVLAALFFVRDPAGSSHLAPGAHGTAFDRTFAFQLGFTEGPERCADIRLRTLEKRITEHAFVDHPSNDAQGYTPLDREMIELLQQSLDQAFERADAEPPRIVVEGGSCPKGGPSTPPASYCPKSNTVTIDLDKLAKIGRPLDSRIPSQGLGDFAAYAEIASRYVLGIQKGVGFPLDDPNAALRTACLVGAWAKATDHPGKELRLASGDLDEAIAELLQPRSLIAADVHGRQVPSGFARVRAMHRGFTEGSQACTTKYP